MRLRHADGTTVHLSYGTNVHPAQDVDGLLDQLSRFGGPVRRRLGVERLGLGLWLPARAAGELARSPLRLEQLRVALAREGLEVVTVNAFPYGHFHAPVVKHAVYVPDWTEDARLDYTLDCAQVLAALLPDDVRAGSISTLPLGWRAPWGPAQRAAAQQRVDLLGDGLARLRAASGRHVRVAFEPEPGCVLQTTSDAVEHLAGTDPEHIGVCLDLCHLATEFEEPAAAIADLRRAGLPVVKVQVSAALHAQEPGSREARQALTSFAEDRFLHQTRAAAGGAVHRRDDLPEALSGPGALADDVPWRVHFHVPVHAAPLAPLRSTTDVLLDALRELVGGPAALADHLEVETYTWSVLPEDLRPRDDTGLVAGIADELTWVADRLRETGAVDA